MQWSMWDRIQVVREQELVTLWRSFIIQALFGFTLNTIPVLVSVLTFGVYVLQTLTFEACCTVCVACTRRPVCQSRRRLRCDNWSRGL